MALLIFTNAELPQTEIECSECGGDVSIGIYGVFIESYEDKKEINNLLDEQKLEACLEGMEHKSLEEIEKFFKK